MKTVLASIAALTLLAGSAAACPFMKTAEHQTMSVASLDEAELPMSQADDLTGSDAKVDDVTTGAIDHEEAETAE